MYLDKLEIEHFRGIKKTTIDELKYVNIFMGKNNSCKTTLLEALFLLMGAHNPEILIRISHFRDLTVRTMKDFSAFFHNLNYQCPITIRAFYGSTSRELTISASQNTDIEELIIPNNEQYSTEYNFTDTENNPKNAFFELLLNLKNEKGIKSESKIKMQQGQQGGFSVQLKQSLKSITPAVYLTPKTGITINLEHTLEDIIVHKKQREIIDILKIIDSNITDITMGTDRRIYLDTGLERLVPLQVAGDGIRRILTVLLAVYDAQNGVLLIDEIENGLHFSTLKTLCKILMQATKKFNVQILATTHSIEVLKSLSATIHEVPEYEKDIKIYTLRKAEDQTVRAYPYNYNEFNFAIEQEIEIR